MDKDEKIEFLYKSIEDIQGTIRSIDQKVFGIIVILILPFSILDQLFDLFFIHLLSFNKCFILLGIIFFGSWFISLAFSFKTAFPLVNPKAKIKGKKGGGYFFGSDLFQVRTLKNNSVLSQKSLDTYTDEIKNDWDIIKELIFEQMKLVYIRSIKIKMQKVAYLTLVLTVFVGSVSWFLHKIF